MKDTISNCKERDTVTFKSKETGAWYTGIVQYVVAPTKPGDEWIINISVILPVEPQWLEDSDQVIFYNEDITDIIIVEKYVP